MSYYMIYGKTSDMKKFTALDVKNLQFVGNLLYATVFHTSYSAHIYCESLQKANTEIQFEVRKKGEK